VSNEVVDRLEAFVNTFVSLYVLLIIVHILLSLVRLPFNLWIYRVRRFVDETVMPFLGLFRRLIPRAGMLDFSPMIAILALLAGQQVLNTILDGFRPGG
jgi:YggT family protein